MSKIDFRRTILPDIEMYGGSTDVWEIPLYVGDNSRMKYDDAINCTFTLIIKDYGYVHRSNGSTYFSLTKPGQIIHDDEKDDLAILRFQFAKAETLSRYGKFTYEVIAEGANGAFRNAAQGNLYITKSIDQ